MEILVVVQYFLMPNKAKALLIQNEESVFPVASISRFCGLVHIIFFHFYLLDFVTFTYKIKNICIYTLFWKF